MCADLQSPPDSLLCGVFPLLLNNTRERNTAVRAASEKAIVQLVHGDQHLKVSTERERERERVVVSVCVPY